MLRRAAASPVARAAPTVNAMKFPKIDSPCPLRLNALPAADRNFCTRCERKVHDLSGMTQVQRRQFLASCSGKVCIAYSVPHARPVAAARMGLGMLAAMAAVPAIAQDATHENMSPFTGVTVLPYAEPSRVDCDDANERAESRLLETIIFVGGVSDPPNVRWVEADAGQPRLPVVPDDAFLDAELIEAPETPFRR